LNKFVTVYNSFKIRSIEKKIVETPKQNKGKKKLT